MRTVEVRVLVTTDDDSPRADDRIETEIRRCAVLSFGADRAYVERAEVKA